MTVYEHAEAREESDEPAEDVRIPRGIRLEISAPSEGRHWDVLSLQRCAETDEGQGIRAWSEHLYSTFLTPEKHVCQPIEGQKP